MSYIVCDVEADGEIPHKYSMVCFGAVIVEPSLSKTFYGTTKPISAQWDSDALAISGFSREEHLEFENPLITMNGFYDWINRNSVGKPIFISDNLAFDWQWINWYFHYFLAKNPFGWSGRRIGDLYCGFYNNMFYQWKKHRITSHTHNPVQDSIGNAEALLYLKEQGLKIALK